MGKERTPQSWHRIEELLDEVLQRPPKEWTEFLDSLSSSDALFRPRLEELLRSTPDAKALLDQPLLEPSPSAIQPGDEIGAYRITRLLEKGGMGEVFEAERSDGAFEKKVAIKFLGLDHHDASLTRRFQTERQILADLVHPNIARLHDGGTTENGRPFLVMEHVDGRRIDAYCDDKKLSIGQRLHLFLKVCEAVSFAHHHAVVHRDIKPSNILVDAQGEPKLLDFGIAKILHTPRHRKGRQPLTVGYAAPEQMESSTVTTSLDVFSLGAVLFELITGHRYRPDTSFPPIDSKEKPSEVVQKTVEDLSGTSITPQSVSETRKASPERLRSLLSGDVDSIVLRAVSGKPEARYRSVEALGQDIESHLAGLPIEARRDEPIYRIWRFINYYRKPLLAAMLCLAFFTFGTLAHLHSLRTERLQQQTFQSVELALHVFQLHLQAQAPIATSHDPSAKDLLDQATASIVLTSEQSARAPHAGLIGSFYVGLGEYEQASPLLGYALDHIDADHPLRNYLEFDQNLVESLMTDSNGSAFSGPPSQGTAYFLNNRAAGLYREGKFQKSIPHYEQALDMATEVNLDKASVEIMRQNLATSYERMGQLDKAIPLLRRILEERQDRYGESSQQTVPSLQMLSVALQSSTSNDELEEAEELAQKALDIEPSPMNLATLATANRMFLYLPSLDELERATRLERARTLFEQAEAESVGEPRGTAVCKLGLSALAQEEERFANAEELALGALEALNEVYKEENHWRLAEANSVLGGALLGQGDVTRAAPLIEQSYDILLDSRGERARPTIEAKHRVERLQDHPDYH